MRGRVFQSPPPCGGEHQVCRPLRRDGSFNPHPRAGVNSSAIISLGTRSKTNDFANLKINNRKQLTSHIKLLFMLVHKHRVPSRMFMFIEGSRYIIKGLKALPGCRQAQSHSVQFSCSSFCQADRTEWNPYQVQ